MEKLIETLYLLRNKYHFNGYIHVKAIPGASEILLKRLGSLADRVSANIELPTTSGLKLLAPNKEESNVTKIMKTIKINHSKKFTPAGQSTQMIVGATSESDLEILGKSESLYNNYSLKRVFYSAYIPVNKDKLLPTIKTPPLVRENRLYQADWLLRFYNYKVNDLFNKDIPNFNILLDPKADWALRHLDEYPKEINEASYYDLLKIPGIGPKNARKIISTRKYYKLEFKDLKKMNISLKRAKYFILCNGKYFTDKNMFNKKIIQANLVLEDKIINNTGVQLSLFNE